MCVCDVCRAVAGWWLTGRPADGRPPPGAAHRSRDRTRPGGPGCAARRPAELAGARSGSDAGPLRARRIRWDLSLDSGVGPICT